MPKVQANGITINYEQQGSGEPLLLIPYLAADNACYAFQVADYAKRFDCISVDPRGAGESDKPVGTYSTQLFADDVAAFMQAIGVERAHVSEPGQVAIAAQLLDQERPVPQGCGRRLADDRQGPWQRHRDDHPGHLSVVLHPGALRRQARLHRPARGLRPRAAEAAA